MKATKNLPENYQFAWEIDIERDKRQMWILQLLGLPWALVVAFLLLVYAVFLQPEIFTTDAAEISIAFSLALLPVLAMSILLHELVHGLFFWFYTREQPRFGFKWLYAYATAPGWYFSTAHYWLIGLSPLVLLSVLGLAVVPFLPQIWGQLVLFGVFANASGAIGDLYIVFRLAFEPAGTMVEDRGSGFRVFRRLG